MSSTVNPSVAFDIRDVTITYGLRKFVAVEGLSLRLDRGGSLALLGLNGAGKTSTIRLLMGMIRPRSGVAEVFGAAPGSVEMLSRVGFAPEEATPPEFLIGEEYLHFVASFRIKDKSQRQKAVDDLMNWSEIPARRKIRDYSKGMRRKLILGQAFIGNPDFLILDEPLNGLDPLFIVKLRERIEDYLKAKGTLLFSSHILSEVEKICQQVAIIKEGRLAHAGSNSELTEKYGSVETAFTFFVGEK